MIRIYLDTSVYNRPFDDQTQNRIWLESQSLAIILRLVEQGDVELITSSVVSFETSRNPYPQRRAWVGRVTGLATVRQRLTPAVAARADELAQAGLKNLDALHVAMAEAGGSEYFITGDDRLIRRYQQILDQRLVTLDPVTFVRLLTEQDEE
jgi:predicted nucleic acid-binding protein